MDIKLRSARIRLAKDHVLTLSEVDGIEIGCETGSLWITQDNDLRDVMLTAGERFMPDRAGKVLVNALQPSIVKASSLPEPARHSALHTLKQGVRAVSASLSRAVLQRGGLVRRIKEVDFRLPRPSSFTREIRHENR